MVAVNLVHPRGKLVGVRCGKRNGVSVDRFAARRVTQLCERAVNLQAGGLGLAEIQVVLQLEFAFAILCPHTAGPSGPSPRASRW